MRNLRDIPSSYGITKKIMPPEILLRPDKLL